MEQSHELYDRILRELPKDGKQANGGIHNPVDLRYLHSCGLIDMFETISGDIFTITITRPGLKFISEGGFTEQYKQRQAKEADESLQRENWIATTKAARNARTIAIVSVIVAALSLAVAVIALIRGLEF